MSEVKKIATRDSYGAALVELAKDHPDVVVLDADLAAATKTGVFKKAYPDHHFDCGIAESNMMATAAGMAAMGLVPFASSFAMFAAGRAFEQVRNSIGYPHLNVKIGATHGGISVGEDGASHQCCEDFALMRSIPGMTVLCPADDVEARAAVKAAYEHQGPVYLRFGRLAVPVIHDEASFKFEIGKGEQLTEGNDVAILATGLEVGEALTAAEQLKNEGIQARVINLCTIKPAAGRGNRRESGPGVRCRCHLRGAQHPGRPGRSGGRGAGRAVPDEDAPCGRKGCLRPLRPRLGPAGAVRPAQRRHRRRRKGAGLK